MFLKYSKVELEKDMGEKRFHDICSRNSTKIDVDQTLRDDITAKMQKYRNVAHMSGMELYLTPRTYSNELGADYVLSLYRE